MADKTTPGGFLYDPTNGGRVDEPTAVNNEARWREVSAQAAAAMDEARKVRYTTTRDHTFILSTNDATNVTVNEARKTFTLGG